MSFTRTVIVLLVASICGALVIALLLLPARQPSRGPQPSARLVGIEPVEAEVREYAVAPDRAAGPAEAVTTRPRPVSGYATVGVTWLGPTPETLRIDVRTATLGRGWSSWQPLAPRDPDTGHRPGGDEAVPGETRSGTAPMAIGEVDRVQLRVWGTLPDDPTLSVIDPGESVPTEVDQPDGAHLAAGSPNRPKIRTRAQWGARERLRDGRPSYGTIRAGFVHHTVSQNSYSRADVPAIIRGIYAYHTRSLGWSDIGYNFLVDRFGRIWEGRYGGIGRAVIGAHTLGYNDVAFAMSAIGNFETTRPSGKMVRAFGRLFGWKLRRSGIGPRSTQRLHGRTLAAISGHRDAGSTACPGRYLYAQLPRIRRLAARKGPVRRKPGPGVLRDLTGDRRPDLVVRNKRTGELVVLRDRRKPGLQFRRVPTGVRAPHARSVMLAGHWNRDGSTDVLGRSDSGTVWWRAGKGDGRLGRGHLLRRGWTKRRHLVVADLTGDRNPDLLGRKVGGAVHLYRGDGRGGLGNRRRVYRSLFAIDRALPVGFWNRDRHRDVIVRNAHNKRLYLLAGAGRGDLRRPVRLTGPLNRWSGLVGIGDVNHDGHPDLVGVRKDRLWVLKGKAHGIRSARNLGVRVGRYDLIG